MKETPLLSVIIAAYNAGDYIEQCLDSVFSQTFRDFEVICVDDGSTDRTGEILDSRRKTEDRLAVIHQENRGAGAARNAGLSMAKGKYLSFLDGDDFFDRSLFAKCVDTLEKEKSDIVVYAANRWNMTTGQSEYFTDSLIRDHLPPDRPFRPEAMKDYLFNSFKTWAWNKMFRADFIAEKGITFQEISRTNDMAFVFLALAQANLVSVINEPLVWYRTGGESSLQATNDRDPSAFWSAYVEIKNRLVSLKLYERYQRSYLNCILQGAFYNLNAMKDPDARQYVRYLLQYEAEKQFGFLKHPREYYYNQAVIADYISLVSQKSIPYSGTGTDVPDSAAENRLLKEQLAALRSSASYRLGKGLLFLPRLIRRAFRRFSE